MNKRLRIAAILILAGLLIELLTLAWNHPLSFLLFILAGGLLLTIGVLFYLYSLAAETGPSHNGDKKG